MIFSYYYFLNFNASRLLGHVRVDHLLREVKNAHPSEVWKLDD